MLAPKLCSDFLVKARPLLILSAILPIACPAAAQEKPGSPPSDPDPPPIVVTGTPQTREQMRERAVDFVRTLGVARGQLPAARWIDPICPGVLGIARSYAEIVEARIRAIAQEAGIRIAGPGCARNITVSFVGDARSLMDVLKRRAPTRFREVQPELRETLINGDAPIRWWYLTGERTRHGMKRVPQAIPMDGGLPLQVEAFSHYTSSVISTQMIRVIVDANVVIDLDRAEGQRLDTVAAYAAFVALAEVRASAAPPPESILGLFGSDAKVHDLTEQDRKFLRTLYQLPLDRTADRHRAMLVSGMIESGLPD